MITWRDRLEASVGCIMGAVLAAVARTAPVGVGILTLTGLIRSLAGPQGRKNFFADLRKVPAPLIMAMVFAALAATSALWARVPAFAVRSGLEASAILLCGHLLRSHLLGLKPQVAALMAGWFVIGLTAGGLFVLIELVSSFAVSKFLAANVPWLGFSNSSMFYFFKNGRIYVNPAFGNWNVALLNILLWPTLLIIALLAPRRRLIISSLFFALVFLISMRSAHQTSQVAVIAGALVFCAAYYWWSLSRKLVFGGAMLLILLMVPAAQIMGGTLNLQQAAWAPNSLKVRFVIWRNVANHYYQAPVLGVGANNTTRAHARADVGEKITRPRARYHTHNMILQVWLELGIVGAGVLLALVFSVARSLAASNVADGPYLLAGFVAIVIEAAATWNMWSQWFLSTVIISVGAFTLCRVIRDFQVGGQTIAFKSIWLPESWSRKQTLREG